MHLDDERLERLRHGELGADVERAAREHLAGCPSCRALVAEAEREESEIHARLHAVDHPARALSWSDVVPPARLAGSAWWRRAAAVLLAVGAAGVAYAAPGSPLPRWVQAAVGLVVERRSPAPPRAPAGIPEQAGIAVDPGRSLLISFRSRQARGRLRVTLEEGSEVELRGPAGAARFATMPDHLVVENAGSTADFELRIPRGAPRVEIRLAGERVFLKEGARITLADDGTAGSPFSLPLSPRDR